MRAAIPVVFVALILGACSWNPPPAQPRPTSSAGLPAPTIALPAPRQSAADSPGEQAAIVAVRQIGVPYRYGGATPRGFDCSGLVQYAYQKAGVSLPRTTAQQWRDFSPVDKRDLRVGDVLFFNISGQISHVGLYLGQGRFVHAPSTGHEVTIAELAGSYYARRFVRGGRPRH